MSTTKKYKFWLSNKTPEYVHGWKDRIEDNDHKEYMYPEQHSQDEYRRGYEECTLIMTPDSGIIG